MDVEFGISCPWLDCEDVLVSAMDSSVGQIQVSALSHTVGEPLISAFGEAMRLVRRCKGDRPRVSAFENDIGSRTESAFGNAITANGLSGFGTRIDAQTQESEEWVPDIIVDGTDLSMANSLTTAVLISLMTDRRSRSDDIIPDGTDPRGWWADAMDGQQIGSRLWLLERARNLPETIAQAEDYIKEALQWLVDDGVAATIKVSCSAARGCKNTLDMLIDICRPQDGDLQFKWRYAWDLRQLRQC